MVSYIKASILLTGHDLFFRLLNIMLSYCEAFVTLHRIIQTYEKWKVIFWHPLIFVEMLPFYPLVNVHHHVMSVKTARMHNFCNLQKWIARSGSRLFFIWFTQLLILVIFHMCPTSTHGKQLSIVVHILGNKIDKGYFALYISGDNFLLHIFWSCDEHHVVTMTWNVLCL